MRANQISAGQNAIRAETHALAMDHARTVNMSPRLVKNSTEIKNKKAKGGLRSSAAHGGVYCELPVFIIRERNGAIALSDVKLSTRG